MLGHCFNYKLVGKTTVNGIQTDLYSFKCSFNLAYVLEVEHHPNRIYIIKFFQKNHKDSRYRYSLLNKKSIRKGSSGAKNFLIILNTIIKVVLEIYSKDKSSSFGFIGSPTKDELNKKFNRANINIDGTVAQTKRFNTYAIYVKRYFSPEKFEHIEISTSSSYLIKSKKSNLKLKSVELFFQNYIELYC